MMVVLTQLHPIIPLLVTLASFQGHSGTEKLELIAVIVGKFSIIVTLFQTTVFWRWLVFKGDN